MDSTHNYQDAFALQQIPLGDHVVQVCAERTRCAQLMITPRVHSTQDGPSLSGSLMLVHAPTGLAVAVGEAARLHELAGRLVQFDWQFSDPGYFTAPANHVVANEIRAVIRTWQIDDAYSGSAHLHGDDEETRAAREREPARTLLREQFEWWLRHSSARAVSWEANKDAWMESITASVEGYGMAYLLAVLSRVAPNVADIAARDLVAAFDAGDSMGEWIYQWHQELTRGESLTLHGIPTADGLAGFANAPDGCETT